MKTPGNCVRIHVAQRLPLLRIMNEKGEDYYVDNKGVRMLAKGYEAVVETACRVGYIDESQLPLLARWRANPSTWTPEV